MRETTNKLNESKHRGGVGMLCCNMGAQCHFMTLTKGFPHMREGLDHIATYTHTLN